MQIFKQARRVNFVDNNNVFVGFEYDLQCCESFGYAFSDRFLSADDRSKLTIRELPEYMPENEADFDLDGCYFDPTFHDVVLGEEDFWHRWSGNSVCFRLINSDEQILYLYLWNHHNGYYCHGFQFHQGDTLIFEGKL